MSKVYDYDVRITCRHEDCPDEIKESIIDEMLKLTKFHSHIIDGDVTLDSKNSHHRMEVLLRVPGLTITAVDEGFHQAKVIDAALAKAKTRLKKIKSRIVKHRVTNTAPAVEYFEADEDTELSE